MESKKQRNNFHLILPPLGAALFLTLAKAMGFFSPVLALLAMLFWMLAWWLSEAVPMAITALLPLVFFPMLKLGTLEQVSANYGDKYIFLFLGGFIMAQGLEKSGLHKRIALRIITLTGSSQSRIVFGFMLSAYLISMWISNTATTLMMFPMALSVSSMLAGQSESGMSAFRLNLFLGIAYASSIGGMATLIGTPPNAAASGILAANFGTPIGFLEWMRYGLPFSFLLLIGAFFLMTRFIFRLNRNETQGAEALLHHALSELGPISKAEKRTLAIFISAIALWLSEGLIRTVFPNYPLNDVLIALVAGISFFIVRKDEKETLLEWSDTTRLPWGILLMFGGGLALAFAFKSSGSLELLTRALAQFNHLPVTLYSIVLCLLGVILTAFMSNLAMVTLFVPVVASLALKLNVDPAVFVIPVTLSASCDFMFPMSTPPNAIAFSSGHIKPRSMLAGGFLLNLLAFGLLSLFVWMFAT
jgi:sodium-dependent dicarboxylate transporter 2/3/5